MFLCKALNYTWSYMNLIEYNVAKSKLKQVAKEEVVARPYIKEKPTLESYGLKSDVEEELKRLDCQYRNNQKDTGRIMFLFVVVMGFAFGIISTYNIRFGMIYSVIALLPGLLTYKLITKGNPPRTKLHLAYESYKESIENYKYWRDKKSADFWLRLTGTAFEYYLAELFCIQGYKATLTKHSGDKGVDIILEKNHDIIIVQCKAHKAKIAPNVARKLDESMRYFGVKKAILASVSGYTQGVYEYVEGKSIQLMDLDDILRLL